MIIIANADGSLSSVKPSSVYQGSNLANEIVFIGEFANSSMVTVAYQLPNGVYTEESYLNFLKDIEIFDNKYNVWIGKINGVVTEKSGLVTAQIFVYPGGYTKEGTYLSPRIAIDNVTFNVNTGVPTNDEIEGISTIGELNDKLANILGAYNQFNEKVLKIMPLVVDEIVELPVDNQYIVVGYKNSIDLASLNYTPKPGDEFFGLFKSNDSYVYGAVAKIIDEDFSDGFASFELIEVCLIHDPVPVIEVDSELSTESENPVQNKVITEAINSSHVVNVTQMSTIYDNESELPSLGASGNGACYLVKTNGELPLVLYAYRASDNKWVKKFEVKPSTLYLNLEDGSLYRYTNNPNTIPYSNFIKITLSPEVIESKIGDIELALDSIIEIQNSLIGGVK